jgi:RNA polymerase sigma-70 factor (ECF subfamily)
MGERSDPERGLSDPELVARVLGGDLDAYATLVDRHRDFVYSIVLRIVGNTADAEDLTQDAFVKTFRVLPTFRGESKFSSWLYRIAVNFALAHVRRRQRAPLSEDVDHEPEFASAFAAPAGGGPEEAALDEELRSRVREAIGRLPPHFRAVVTLYYLQERSYVETAAVLGLPLGTVKTHLHRARAMLAGILGEMLEES